MKLIEKGPFSIDQSTRYKVFGYNQHVEQNQDGAKSYHDCLKVFDDCTLVANIEGFKKYDIIKHFKYETLTDEMQKQHIYIYQVLMTSVLDTETDEKLIIYKALYNGKLYGMNSEFGQVFARPEKMFYEEVNQEKYPNINQKHRFELVRHMNHEINEKEVNKLKI